MRRASVKNYGESCILEIEFQAIGIRCLNIKGASQFEQGFSSYFAIFNL